MHSKAFPLIGLLSLVWGVNIVVSRVGIGEFDPYLFSAARLAVATLSFALIYLLQGGAWPREATVWRHGFVSGILGVSIPMTLFLLSLQYQSSGMTSIFVTSGPALMVLGAHIFLPDEKMTRNKAVGVILAFAGSLFLVLRGESGLVGVGRASVLGFLLILIAMGSDVANAIFVRRRMLGMDPIAVTGIRLLVGALLTGLVALFVSKPAWSQVSLAAYGSLLYAGLFGALGGQFLAYTITRQHGATAFSLTSYLIPIVATTFGVLLLGEIVTWGMGVGVVLIGGGIYLINRPVRAVRRQLAAEVY